MNKGKILTALVTGIASGVACQFLQSRVTFFKNWWAAPAALLVGGYLLTRSRRDVLKTAGMTMVGVGALKGYQNYRLTSSGSDDLPANPYTEETGALIDPTSYTSAGAPSAFEAHDFGDDDEADAEEAVVETAMMLGRRAA